MMSREINWFFAVMFGISIFPQWHIWANNGLWTSLAFSGAIIGTLFVAHTCISRTFR